VALQGADDLCEAPEEGAPPCSSATHQSRSLGHHVAGRTPRRLWRGHLLLYWPAASHRKYFSSRWQCGELSGLPESQINTSTHQHSPDINNSNNVAPLYSLSRCAPYTLTFVVAVGVGCIHKLLNVAHRLWNADEELHRVVLVVLEVQQSLHQGGLTMGLICGSNHTFREMARRPAGSLRDAPVVSQVSHSHRESESFFMFWRRYWCRLSSLLTSPLATASNNLSMVNVLLSLLCWCSPRVPLSKKHKRFTQGQEVTRSTLIHSVGLDKAQHSCSNEH